MFRSKKNQNNNSSNNESAVNTQNRQQEADKIVLPPVSDVVDQDSNLFNDRPRICLIDIPVECELELKKRKFNCYSGSLGKRVKIPTDTRSEYQCILNHNFPDNLHEYDICIINLNTDKVLDYNPKEHKRNYSTSPTQLYLRVNYPQTIFDPRALSAKILRAEINNFTDRQSVTIIFAGPNAKVDYFPVSISHYGKENLPMESYNIYDFYSDLPYNENITGIDTNVIFDKNPVLTSLIKRFNKEFNYHITFTHPTEWDGNRRIKCKSFIPLVEAGKEQFVSFAHIRNNNTTFVFPELNSL